MSKFRAYLPSAKIANLCILALCIFEFFQLYQVGFNKGYEVAVEQLVDTEVVLVRTQCDDNCRFLN